MHTLVFTLLFCTCFVCFSAFTPVQSTSKSGTAGAGKVIPGSVASKELIANADQLFTRGEDPDKDRQALTLLESALPAEIGNYEILWRAARANYYVGDFAVKTKRLPYFEKGVALAKRAVLLQPNAVEGHFWLAANYGGQAQLVGALKALSTVRKIRNEMLTVVKINAAYEAGNAYLALGEIDRELPAIMGGDKKRAVSYYETGLKLAPDNLDLKVALAKAWLDDGKKESAEKLLAEVQAVVATTRAQRDAQEDAKKLLQGK